MTLTKEDISKIARLARIGMDDQEKERMVSELSKIMGWIKQLEKIDTSSVEPWRLDMDLYQREDCVVDGGYASKIVQNGPSQMQGYFSVPKVVE
jgi:aspartyl-tRNA(Asn)/glutamyl-tRNA(Gln) amidotransferase subunit C